MSPATAASIPPEIRRAFHITPTAQVAAISTGNINATYTITTGDASYILQTLNHAVFKNPAAIAVNLRVISTHLASESPDYVFPAPLPTDTGDTLICDQAGVFWRLLPYIDNTDNFNTPPSVEHAYNAALAFATFTNHLHALPAAALQDTIPHFHDLTRYEHAFHNGLKTAAADRLEQAATVIEELTEFAIIGNQYRTSIKKNICKKRIHHHDTKINNLLFHHGKPTVKALIDLDTIMPGYFFSDLGDLLMFGSGVFEDETDLDKVVIDTEYYKAILAGYQTGLVGTLSEAELELMPLAGRIMCYMLCLRFLTDYLAGEIYFKTQYEGQNLDKARNRLKLLQELDQLTL